MQRSFQVSGFGENKISVCLPVYDATATESGRWTERHGQTYAQVPLDCRETHPCAVFHTLDHSIVLSTLYVLELTVQALDWFCSKLANRSQRVLINGKMSDSYHLEWGVPQGSCLGPVRFILYAGQLFAIVKDHHPQIHCYLVDIHMYLSFRLWHYYKGFGCNARLL